MGKKYCSSNGLISVILTAPSETMVKGWYADFKHGCTDTNDAECSGHPNSAENSINSFWLIIN